MLISFRGTVFPGVVAALLWLAPLAAVHAQSVRGVCVSNCGSGQQAQPQPQVLDPRMFWIGATASVQGDVTFVYPTGQRVRGDEAARTPIPLGARVITGPSGHVRFLLIDETTFVVGPSSEIVMDRFVYDPDSATPVRMALNIVKGSFRFVTGRLVRTPEAMRITTAVVTIGPRGTAFEIQADPGGSGYVLVEKGQLSAEEFDTGRTFTISEGQRLRYENFKIVALE